MPTENECSNRATATEKTYAKAMIVEKLGVLKEDSDGVNITIFF